MIKRNFHGGLFGPKQVRTQRNKQKKKLDSKKLVPKKKLDPKKLVPNNMTSMSCLILEAAKKTVVLLETWCLIPEAAIVRAQQDLVPDDDVLPDPGGRPKGQNNDPKDLAEA